MHGSCLIVTLLCGSAALPAAAQSVLVAQSEIGFVSRQMGVPVTGKFTRWSAQLVFDPKKPAAASVAFTIDVASATFGSDQADAEVPRAPWFNAAKFPQARFESSAVSSLGNGRFDVAGKLTIKGTTRDAVVPVTFSQNGIDGAAQGSFTIKRLDYKIGDGEWADTAIVANEVLVKFKLMLTNLPPM
jgi:polyisoprenoid-binding protein YceI